jgi:hypothetical protein
VDGHQRLAGAAFGVFQRAGRGLVCCAVDGGQPGEGRIQVVPVAAGQPPGGDHRPTAHYG